MDIHQSAAGSFPVDKANIVESSRLDSLDSKLLYKIFMQAPAMLSILKGPQHVFELANEPCRKLLGNRNPIGKPVKEVLPELKEQGLLKILDEVYQTGEAFTGNEMPLILESEKGGAEMFMNFTFQPFFDENQKNKGILVFAYDVTDQVASRNKAEESESRYRELIYGLPSALYTCDADGYIQLYNESAVKLWGREPIIGKDVWCGSWEIFTQDGSPMPLEECPMAIALKENRIVNTELIVRRPDGTERNIIPYPRPILGTSGKIIGAVNTLIDVTSQAQSRREMEQIAEMIERLYMQAPAFICTLKGPDHVFELVNPEYQKLYGKRELLGKKVLDALPELEGQGIMEKLYNVYHTGEPYVVTEMLLHLGRDEGKEPEPTYLNFSYQPMYNAKKEIKGILVFGYEVTEQVMAKKKGEEDLRQVLESLPQITSTSSASGTNIFFNKFFYEYSGLSMEEATLNGWNSILHPEELETVLESWENCKKKGEDFYQEIRLKRCNDQMYRWHISRITPIKSSKGEITQWIASATDIHEQKTKEQKKDEFISIASHEMKTPLTTAKAYLQLLELSLEGTNSKAALYTKKAIHSIERLKDLISELLDVSKIQHGKLNFNFCEFDFNEMIDEAIDAIQHISPNHRIIKSGAISKMVFADKERLEQVIINLLSNAVKYSPQANKVFISSMIENDQLKVAVKDHGIGISSGNLEKIFERYFRIEGEERHIQGLGIGLFICMEIIQRHKGKIWAESEEGQGSTFYFCIPMKIEND